MSKTFTETMRARRTIDANDAKDATYTYWSLEEFADECQAIEDSGASYAGRGEPDRDFYQATSRQALSMAKQGWDKHLPETLAIMESAVEMCEQEHIEMRAREVVFDVAGDSVDIGRYLAGEPECMMDYPLQETSVAGRVVTLCASVGYSGSIAGDVIVARGQVITAFALALSQLGHACEIWADFSVDDYERHKSRFRILVKGADDTLDPSRILFAFSHPAMLRRLGFMAESNQPDDWSDMTPYGTKPIAPKHDLPDGCIYLPEVLSSRNIPDADKELAKLLAEVGLIESAE